MLRAARCFSPLQRLIGQLLSSAVLVAARHTSSDDQLGKGVVCLFVIILFISCLCRPDLHRNNQGSKEERLVKTFTEKQRQEALEFEKHKDLVLSNNSSSSEVGKDDEQFNYQSLAPPPHLW